MYPLTHFHQGGASDKIMVCEGGVDKGKFCKPTSNNVISQTPQCTPAVDKDGKVVTTFKCVVLWQDAMPVSANYKYGCFFSSPTSQSELQYEYKKYLCYRSNKSKTEDKGCMPHSSRTPQMLSAEAWRPTRKCSWKDGMGSIKEDT
jgi:hypothetical protein